MAGAIQKREKRKSFCMKGNHRKEKAAKINRWDSQLGNNVGQ